VVRVQVPLQVTGRPLTGRRFRVFNVEHQLTREGLVAEVDTSLPSPRAARTLDGIVAERGKPD
jgi:hypothetical protein